MQPAVKVDIVKEFNPAFGSISELINRLLPNLYLLAGIILFLLLVGGGIMMLKSASEGEAEGMAQGKKAATYAIIGFVIIAASFWLVKLIAKITGIVIF